MIRQVTFGFVIFYVVPQRLHVAASMHKKRAKKRAFDSLFFASQRL
jgi:hypothetical protein